MQGWPLAAVATLVDVARRRQTEAVRDGEWRAVDVFTVGSARPSPCMAPGWRRGPAAAPRAASSPRPHEEIERARRKLADARFVERAPAHLVEAERDKAERFEREAAELRARLADLGA